MKLKSLLVVGFAGKDIEKTMEHIRELEAEGVKFEDLPDDWVCPLCGVGKENFEEVK